MIAGLKAWWHGLRHLEHQGYLYVWANFCALLVSIPIITAPAAWAGLMKMSHTAHRSRFVTLNDFWSGFRENLPRGFVMFGLNVVIVGLNLINLWSFSLQSGLITNVLRTVWITVLLFWFTVQLYVWPIFYQMEQPTLWKALKNAALMIVLNPWFTLGLWIGILPLLIVSVLLPPIFLLLTLAALSVVANSAVNDRLQAAGFKTEVLGEDSM
ncbi:MAG: DUF624 domain-containing protein [Chitinophagaceae bacterium]|nr:DUF624 domain-containing protein [Anaerolineae bacterium]